MKDNQIDGFVDQIMNHPQIQLSHSPDYLTGPFDILLYSPKQVPFLRQTSHTRRFCAGRERYKVYAGTKAPLRLHEVVVSFVVEKTMTIPVLKHLWTFILSPAFGAPKIHHKCSVCWYGKLMGPVEVLEASCYSNPGV